MERLCRADSSSGLCIARAVAVKPDILLLDERLRAGSHLDAKIEQLITELKKDLHHRIVTHNMQQAARVSNYTAFMYLGHLVEFGDTKENVHQAGKQQTEEYITGGSDDPASAYQPGV